MRVTGLSSSQLQDVLPQKQVPKTFRDIQTIQRKISVEMKVLESLTYTFAEQTVLYTLLGGMKEVKEKIRSVQLQADGWLLRPA